MNNNKTTSKMVDFWNPTGFPTAKYFILWALGFTHNKYTADKLEELYSLLGTYYFGADCTLNQFETLRSFKFPQE